MSRSSKDFDFIHCEDKPCGAGPLRIVPDPTKSCTGAECRFYGLCDLKGKKTPWQKPVVQGATRLPA